GVADCAPVSPARVTAGLHEGLKIKCQWAKCQMSYRSRFLYDIWHLAIDPLAFGSPLLRHHLVIEVGHPVPAAILRDVQGLVRDPDEVFFRESIDGIVGNTDRGRHTADA